MSRPEAATRVTWWWAIDGDQLAGEGSSSEAALDPNKTEASCPGN